MLSKREASTLCPTNAPLLTKESDDLFDRRSSVQSLKYWMSKKKEIDGSVEKFLHLKQIQTFPHVENNAVPPVRHRPRTLPDFVQVMELGKIERVEAQD